MELRWHVATYNICTWLLAPHAVVSMRIKFHLIIIIIIIIIRLSSLVIDTTPNEKKKKKKKKISPLTLILTKHS